MENSKNPAFYQATGRRESRNLVWALVILGFITVLVQTVALREFLALCQGTEITLGLALAAWLAGGAVGSLLAGGILKRWDSRYGPFWGFIILALFCPLMLVVIRGFRSLAGMFPGQSLSLGQVSVLSVLALAPLGALLASQYCFGVGMLEKSGSSSSAGRAYHLEAWGYLFGGLAFTFILAARLPAAACLLLCSVLSFTAGWLISLYRVQKIGSLMLSAIAMAAAVFGSEQMENRTLGLVFPGSEIKAASSSPYGQTVVAGREGQLGVFYQGSPILQHPVAVSMGGEEAVALGLASSGRPERVLAIGGLGLMPILLRQDIKSLELAEPDPRLISTVARQRMPGWDSLLLDGRVVKINQDGRTFLNGRGHNYDLIILDLPYPVNLGWNRYYTLEFYHAVRKRLNPDGALVVILPGSEASVNPNIINLMAIMHRTMSAVFPHLILAQGQSTYLAAGLSAEAVSDAELYRRCQILGTNMSFFSAAQMPYLLDKQRRRNIINKIEQARPEDNRDLKPRALAAGLLLWQSTISPAGEKAYNLILKAAPALWLALLILFFRPKTKHAKTALATGAGAMGLQTLCLWGVQVKYGTLYHWLGLANALFMAGTAIGSFWAARQRERPKIAVLELMWLGWCLMFAVFSAGGILLGWGYLLGSGLTGLLLGLEYPALVAGYAQKRSLPQTFSAPALYAADLGGGMAAAILAGMVLIPAWGMAGAAAFFAGLKLVSLRWWLFKRGLDA